MSQLLSALFFSSPFRRIMFPAGVPHACKKGGRGSVLARVLEFHKSPLTFASKVSSLFLSGSSRGFDPEACKAMLRQAALTAGHLPEF